MEAVLGYPSVPALIVCPADVLGYILGSLGCRTLVRDGVVSVGLHVKLPPHLIMVPSLLRGVKGGTPCNLVPFVSVGLTILVLIVSYIDDTCLRAAY